MAEHRSSTPSHANEVNSTSISNTDHTIELYVREAHSQISKQLDFFRKDMVASKGKVFKAFHARLASHAKDIVSGQLKDTPASQRAQMDCSVGSFNCSVREDLRRYRGTSKVPKSTKQSTEATESTGGRPENSGPSDGSHETVKVDEETVTGRYHLTVQYQNGCGFLKLHRAFFGSVSVCTWEDPDTTSTDSQQISGSLFWQPV